VRLSVATAQRRRDYSHAVALDHHPPSFQARFEELSVFCASARFAAVFPGTRLLTAHEARTVHVGRGLRPFMVTEREHPDVYAFDTNTPGPEHAVVVWSVHTVVQQWSDFEVFFRWLCTQ
jgi:hypothetical protein